jgi:hypothetical protein
VAAGLHLTVRVDSVARERELVEQAASVDVEINGLSGYWLPDSRTPEEERAGLVLGFAAVPEVAIEAALERLRSVWNGKTGTVAGLCGEGGLCRSELARDGLHGGAFIQETRVIVNVHRRNAARTNRASTTGSALDNYSFYVPDLILVQALVLARSASRGRGCRV